MATRPAASQPGASLRVVEIAVLSLLLGLAAYLRLTHLAHNPGWYTDEGTHLNIAQNLLQGRVQYMAISQSTLLVARMPLFESLLAGLLSVSRGGIDTLRTLTGVLGVISVGLLYGVVRRTQAGQAAALPLLSAFMLAVYPQAVLYSRFGFSYNLLTPLVLLTCLGLWEYLGTHRRRWLVIAAVMSSSPRRLSPGCSPHRPSTSRYRLPQPAGRARTCRQASPLIGSHSIRATGKRAM